MVGCTFLRCTHHSNKSKKASGITYHRFPEDWDLRIKWVTVVRNQRNDPTWEPKGGSRICSSHFKDSDFYFSPKGFKHLFKGAIPSDSAETVVLIFGVMGACRREELYNVQVDDVQDFESNILVKINNRKTKTDRSFTVTGKYYEICKKYMKLRPNPCNNHAFFLHCNVGKCTTQKIGVNKFGNIGKTIASYLDLPNPELFTGHCFRRTSANLSMDAGDALTALKQHGGNKIQDVCEQVLLPKHETQEMSCCVKGCTSKTWKSNTISFHGYPKDEETRKKWLELVPLDQLNKDKKICAKHFKRESFMIFENETKLKAGAIPELFLNVPQGGTVCTFQGCENNSNEYCMFPYPTTKPGLLKIWLENSGNPNLSNLPTEILMKKFVCEQHFSPQFIHKTPKNASLKLDAVPWPCNKKPIIQPESSIKRKYRKTKKASDKSFTVCETKDCLQHIEKYIQTGYIVGWDNCSPSKKTETVNELSEHLMDEKLPELLRVKEVTVLLKQNKYQAAFANHPQLLNKILTPKTKESSGIFKTGIFRQFVKPLIVYLYKSRETEIRLKLLDKLMDYLAFFTEAEMVENILPEILIGMKDVDKSIVRATLLSLANLVDILGPQVVMGQPREELFIRNDAGNGEKNDKTEIMIENDDSANESDSDIEKTEKITEVFIEFNDNSNESYVNGEKTTEIFIESNEYSTNERNSEQMIENSEHSANISKNEHISMEVDQNSDESDNSNDSDSPLFKILKGATRKRIKKEPTNTEDWNNTIEISFEGEIIKPEPLNDDNELVSAENERKIIEEYSIDIEEMKLEGDTVEDKRNDKNSSEVPKQY